MNNLIRGGGVQNAYFDVIATNNTRATSLTFEDINIFILKDGIETQLTLVAGTIGDLIDSSIVHIGNGTYQLGVPAAFLTSGRNVFCRFTGASIKPSVFIINLVNQRIAQ